MNFIEQVFYDIFERMPSLREVEAVAWRRAFERNNAIFMANLFPMRCR